MNNKSKYPWIIALGCGMVMFYGVGLGYNCMSVFLNPLMMRLGVTNALRSSMTVFFQAGSMVGFLVVNRLIKKIGNRQTIGASGICMAAGYGILALTHSLSFYYGAMLMIGIAYGAGTTVPCSLVIQEWFVKKRGMILGLTACGSGVASFLFPAFLSALIERAGVVWALLFHGAMILILTGIGWGILRDKPASKSTVPYGYTGDERRPAPDQIEEMTLSRIVKSRHMAPFFLSIMLIGCIISPLVTHLSPIISQSGFHVELAAVAISIYGGAMLVGKPLYGLVVDKVSILKSNTYIYFLLFLALADGLLLQKGPVFVFGLAVLLGLGGAPIMTVGVPIWVGRIYGETNLGDYLATLKIGFFLGGTIGGSIPGVVMDMTGGYTGLFKLYIGALILSFVMLQQIFQDKK